MLYELKDVKFTDPVVIAATMDMASARTAINEFRSTSSIKVDHIPGDQFDYLGGINAPEYVSYIKANMEVSKIDVNSDRYDKVIYIIEINDDIRKELNLQEIPYYAVSEFWPDSFAIATNEFKNERLVNPDLGLSMYDFIITGLSSVFQSDALVNTVGISDPSYSAVLKFEKVMKKAFREYDWSDDFQYFVDSYGHFVLRSKDAISDKKLYKMFKKAHIGKHDANYMACTHRDMICANCDYDDNVIVFKRYDALAVIHILNKILNDSGKTDVETFGDDAISYERLCDVADCMLYPMITKTYIVSDYK